MRPVLSRQQVRDFERQFVEGGLPSLLLMENAGRGAAHLIGLWGRPRRDAPQLGKPPRGVGGSCVRCADEAPLRGLGVLVLAGPGNNGGDGFVVARHLLGRGARVTTLLWGGRERIEDDARLALLAWEAVGGQVLELSRERLLAELPTAEIVVDALLGTGAVRELRGELAEVIGCVNDSSIPVVSLDLPSGLDTDSGRVLGQAIVARHTVTFGHLKSGLLTTTGHKHAGRITISQLGVPATLPAGMTPRAWLLEVSDLRERLIPRPPTAHKGSAGHVVIVAGSPGTVGAARLVGHAAFRGGAGLCTLVSTRETARLLDGEVVELMTHGFDAAAPESTAQLLGRAGSLVVGPGLGQGDEVEQLVALALAARRPTVLDAAGLRAVGGGLGALRGHPALVITPHPGEAAELLGVATGAIEQDRFGAAEELASHSGAVVVLKGSRTIVAAPQRAPYVSAWGSPALATAGSGDVLAGLLGALLVPRATSAEGVLDASLLAVGVHALSGEICSETSGDAGLLASEIADGFSQARARLVEDGSSSTF